jgi:hypothetical protein
LPVLPGLQNRTLRWAADKAPGDTTTYVVDARHYLAAIN